ncbi:MAG: hypothetical protein KGP28_01915 [Bdellovibrionales bacterium]|nr:hypothetical protein [Bdellovibrionales bacterium]
MGLILGVFFFVFFASNAQAIENPRACSYVDLRPRVALQMRNQGDISWCYAHVAADLLQFQSLVQEQISAADIAVQYNRGLWPRFYRWINGTLVPETGFLSRALRQAGSSGYCPEADFPSDFWTRVELTSQNAPKLENRTLNFAIAEILDLQRRVKAGIFKSGSELPYFYQFPGVGPGEFFSILKAMPRHEVLEGLRQKACEGRRRPYPVGIGSITMHFRGPGMFERFHGELEEGRPLSIDYFYGVLENSSNIEKKIADLHTSMVLGQRFDSGSGECQYLVKNSYGDSCGSYDPKWECQGGYLWIGEAALRKAMVSYVFLSPQEN